MKFRITIINLINIVEKNKFVCYNTKNKLTAPSNNIQICCKTIILLGELKVWKILKN